MKRRLFSSSVLTSGHCAATLALAVVASLALAGCSGSAGESAHDGAGGGATSGVGGSTTGGSGGSTTSGSGDSTTSGSGGSTTGGSGGSTTSGTGGSTTSGTGGGAGGEVLVSEDFESDPFGDPDGLGFTDFQFEHAAGTTDPSATLVDQPVHSGAGSMAFSAPAQTWDPGAQRYLCGKADIGKDNLDVQLGDTVSYDAWFYVTDKGTYATLMDVECSLSVCGLDGQPGLRLGITEATNGARLLLGYKFGPGANDAPPNTTGSKAIPIGEWFELELWVQLGKGGQGLTRAYINGELDIEVAGTNMIPDGLEALDTYNSFQVGLTCNEETSVETTIEVDDVTVVRYR